MPVDERVTQQMFGARKAPDGSSVKENFARWFGESKVTDAEGVPMVVYHASSRNITEFRTKGNGESTGNVTAVWGSFFTPDPEEASRYAKDFHTDGQNISPVYLSLRNPLSMSRLEWDQHAMKVFRGMSQEQAIIEEKKFRENLEAQGYDGVIVRGRGFNNEYVAFHAWQIKSAIGNSGMFDSISNSLGDALDPERQTSVLIGTNERPSTKNKPFRNPTQVEIVQLLRAHPLIKLRERVTQAFVVGSFAKEQMGVGETRPDSDVDILLEVLPRKIGGYKLTNPELDDHYRQALRQHFMRSNIRGKMDSVHPQWMGRRVDLYFTYDADCESRPKIKLEAGTPKDDQSVSDTVAFPRSRMRN